MLTLLLGVAVLAQWFFAPLGLTSSVVLVLYTCIFITIALRQWVWLLWSLLATALLLLFSASSLVLATAAVGGGIITLGIFSRYVDVGQIAIRTATLCFIWFVWVVSVLASYSVPNIGVYVITVSVHMIFILVWSSASSIKELA